MATHDASGSDDAPNARLTAYHRKRDFTRTTEPRGSAAARARGAGRFVVQLHDATAMHFDFRLEVDGVLKSWAVPKGPSNDPGVKRLAMPTEDHPLEYRDFEGVIAPGEYGGGTVMIWDEGTYVGLTHDRRGEPVDFADALARGHASFRLDGHKLRGTWALTRFRGGDDGEREAWLLVRAAHDAASGRAAPDPRRARSVRTGRGLRAIATESRPADDTR